MKSTRFTLPLMAAMLVLNTACKKEKNDSEVETTKDLGTVYYQEINKTITSADLSEMIEVDVSNDGTIDLIFEIINLNDYNDPALPHNDTLAARVITPTSELLDNSTYGYPDAFDEGYELKSGLSWISRPNSVLGTFGNGGKFNGQGEKYLGFRLTRGGKIYYGWVLLECSENKDTLRVISSGINEVQDTPIETGRTE